MQNQIPQAWRELLADEFSKPYFLELSNFVDDEYATGEIFPARENLFRALELVSPAEVMVVIMGQDPYHDVGQAHGLAFSVQDGVKFPPSLRNILKEVQEDCGGLITPSGSLERWAQQGVLLLNAVLTVRAHSANSHAKRGWEKFTDAVVAAVAQNQEGVVYMLWGSHAHKKGAVVPTEKNLVLKSVHPSPLSVYRGFSGCKHFSKANNYLILNAKSPIEW
ncbi:MAG: uracil-DNA glycosylase [Rikenellaceae bacterium]